MPTLNTRDEWSRLKDSFHRALELPAADRRAFIREACDGNAALEAALESLLASDDAAREFLETPAVARVGLPSLHASATLMAGDRLGPYEILEWLGAGGMGEVYCARDARLERDVALKVLPAPVMNDTLRQQWLTREAQAAAALDHPNICPIFDIGEQNGRVWVAMQYVEGETLARRLRRGPLDVTIALDVTTQIANALGAAHGRGIVHRDVKPDNVMITATGQVKVLDFGLAAIAAEPGTAAVHSEQRGVQSRRLGTLPYMSPEQVQGAPIDVRTDVFSLAVVLHEMVTGDRPFGGDTDENIRSAILSAAPPPVRRFSAAANLALNRIMRKGLAKERSARYQTMSEMAADVESVRRRLAIAPQRSGHLAWVAGGTQMAVVAGLVAAALWWAGRQQRPRESASPLEYEQLTNFPDSVQWPALSPDGTIVAFVRDAQTGGGQELYVKDLPDGQPRRLTDDGGVKIGPSFSPDGSSIVYTRGMSTFTVPVAGGTPRSFKANATGLQWIGPEELLFSEMKQAPNMGIVWATRDGAHVRDVYVPASPTGMAHHSARSPDGSQVLVVEMDNAWLPCRVVPFDGSSPGRLVGPTPAECRSASWSPDGRWMYFAATVNGESHIWRQRFPDGVPEQLTSGPTQERGLAIDPDGRSIISAAGAAQSTVWYHDEQGERPVSIEGYAYRPVVSPDESRVFYLVRRVPQRSFSIGELWAADLRSGSSRRLLPEFLVSSYHVSPDGRLLVFDSFDPSGHSAVWIAAVDDGLPPRRLTPDGGSDEQRPFVGASGAIYFMQRRRDGLSDLYRMRQDGTGRQRIDTDIDFLVSISPDERWAVLWSFRGTRLIPLAGGPSHALCPCGIGPLRDGPPGVTWTLDGRTLLVNAGDDGVGNVDAATVVIPWRGAAGLPRTPVRASTDLSGLPGARVIPVSGVAPGRTAARYAFSRETEQTNLYRIRLP
ncbi:MAG TPA: protein kinase [Vicinamibacterales bacterium]|nr:protein kinase [Vicinamibacterales bacterium]